MLKEKLGARALSERDFKELHSVLTRAYAEMARRNTRLEEYVEFISRVFCEYGNESGRGGG